MKPLRKDLWASWWRTFAIQGSWNYETLIGGGMAFALLPLLRRVYAGDPVRFTASVTRHLAAFNSHPYFAGLAVGALARVELDGASEERIERFRTALRGPLGTVGDRVVWASWRPACLLTAIAGFGLGMGPLWALLLFLAPYNIGHIAIRVWGFRRGWTEGFGVTRALNEPWLDRVPRLLSPLILSLLGLDAVLLSRRVLDTVAWTGPYFELGLVAAFVTLMAFRWPSRTGRIAVALIVSIPIVWVIQAAIVG